MSMGFEGDASGTQTVHTTPPQQLFILQAGREQIRNKQQNLISHKKQLEKQKPNR